MSGPDGHKKAVVLDLAKSEEISRLLSTLLERGRYVILLPTANVSSPSKKRSDTRLRATSIPINVYARVALLCRLKLEKSPHAEKWDNESSLRLTKGFAKQHPVDVSFRPTRAAYSNDTFMQAVHHTMCTIEPVG